jgi:hypothetical protein
MKTNLLIVMAAGLVIGLPEELSALEIGYGPATQIARDPSLPGRNMPGQCLVFARALNARLQAAGIPSRLIEYRYDGPVMGASSHAVVAYEEHGRTYIIDNQSWAPTWVREDSLAAMAQRFSGPYVAVLGARVMPEESDLSLQLASASGRHRHSADLASRRRNQHLPSANLTLTSPASGRAPGLLITQTEVTP